MICTVSYKNTKNELKGAGKRFSLQGPQPSFVSAPACKARSHQTLLLIKHYWKSNYIKDFFLRPYISERDRYLILSISRVVCFNTSQFSVIPLTEEIGNKDNFLNLFQSVFLNTIILVLFVPPIFL